MEADKGFAANVFGYGRRQAVNHRFLQRDIKGNSSPKWSIHILVRNHVAEG